MCNSLSYPHRLWCSCSLRTWGGSAGLSAAHCSVKACAFASFCASALGCLFNGWLDPSLSFPGQLRSDTASLIRWCWCSFRLTFCETSRLSSAQTRAAFWSPLFGYATGFLACGQGKYFLSSHTITKEARSHLDWAFDCVFECVRNLSGRTSCAFARVHDDVSQLMRSWAFRKQAWSFVSV